jgi:hypothetical protein
MPCGKKMMRIREIFSQRGCDGGNERRGQQALTTKDMKVHKGKT